MLLGRDTDEPKARSLRPPFPFLFCASALHFYLRSPPGIDPKKDKKKDKMCSHGLIKPSVLGFVLSGHI